MPLTRSFIPAILALGLATVVGRDAQRLESVGTHDHDHDHGHDDHDHGEETPLS